MFVSFNHTSNRSRYRSVQTPYFFFWLAVVQRPRGFFSRLRLGGKQGAHRYITTHASIPAELRGGALEHPTSMSWLSFSRGRVPPCSSSRAGAWKTPHLQEKKKNVRRVFVCSPLTRPPHNIISPNVLPFLCCLLRRSSSSNSSSTPL